MPLTLWEGEQYRTEHIFLPVPRLRYYWDVRRVGQISRPPHHSQSVLSRTIPSSRRNLRLIARRHPSLPRLYDTSPPPLANQVNRRRHRQGHSLYDAPRRLRSGRLGPAQVLEERPYSRQVTHFQAFPRRESINFSTTGEQNGCLVDV
jgi:hypothetical protein